MLSIERDSSIGRAIENGYNSDIDTIAAFYSYNEWLEDNFGDNKVIFSFNDNEIEEQSELVPVNLVIDYLAKLEEWEEINEILISINSTITVKEVKKHYEEVTSMLNLSKNERTACRASATVDYQSRPIREKVGETLNDGTVMLTCFKKKAYPIIGGKWAHAGIFSEDAFKKYGKKDSSHCVYTAQPNGYDDFPVYMKPDRQNRCCLDTLCMYTYQNKMATLLPLRYNKSSAKVAVNYAKEAFYDKTNNTYRIPVFEFFRIGNTSHDMSVKNPYCSKVVYSAWKKAGVDLDSNTFGGNLVTPDDLYGSAFNRYITVTIRFLFWSKSWTKQTYSGTSFICTEEHL